MSSNVMNALEGLELPAPLGTVGPKCDQDSGQWMCVSHATLFGNNLQLESHTSDGEGQTHLLVWHCYRHGPEVP